MVPRRHARLAIAGAGIVGVLFVMLQSSSDSLLPPISGGFSSGRDPVRFQKSAFDWSTVQEHHPSQHPAKLPSPSPGHLPRVQHDFGPDYKSDAVTERRRDAVRNAFVRSWQAYKEHAWLRDELRPVSGSGKDTFGGWAATLVDSLDTLWIMGLRDDFYEAAQAAAALDWSNTTEKGINLFETTIRHLGGLLSAYDLSGEPALLEKARELGDMLYMAFDTPNRLPGFWLTFEDAKAGTQMPGTHDPSAGPASLSLELTRLSQLTGDSKYFSAADAVRSFLQRTQGRSLLPGMWPTMINFLDQDVQTDDAFTLGALADSLYEYLLKMAVLVPGTDVGTSYKEMYLQAMDVVVRHLLFRPMLPNKEDILFSGTVFVRDGRIDLESEGQHLSCFAGGMFAMGGKLFNVTAHVDIGERLARGCSWAYAAFPTGLMPEIFNLLPCETPLLEECAWDEERWARDGNQALPRGFRNARDPKYILRPEAIESIFILYRVTGRAEFRDVAWTMFESIMKATETDIANSAIEDVTVKGETKKTDSMESFWLAETLKYFYLIFSPPDVISLDTYVLNTEAHPLKRPG